MFVVLVAAFSWIETFWQGYRYQLIAGQANQSVQWAIGFRDEKWGLVTNELLMKAKTPAQSMMLDTLIKRIFN
jgi:hypothetical protein